MKKFIKRVFEIVLEETLAKQTYINQRLLTASIVNSKAFKKYKGVLRGKDAVLIAAGPSAADFKLIKEAVYIGCNRAFLLKDVQFDFLFSIDKVGIDKYYKDFFEYREGSCIKFIGDQNLGKDYQIPENIIPLEDKNTFRYITNAGIESAFKHFPLDISTAPLYNSSTVSIQALQFILYTQPRRIYIVGVDCTCSTKKHFIGQDTDCSFRGEDVAQTDKYSIESYKLLKEFAQTYYPLTEIISVNPVGLKGLFEDVYTQSYIEKNKDLIKNKKINLKILKE